ncbi:hypothetical protein MPH_01396 [Macrophomina phaseolina MS6]|uniref:Rhodopsin domain-containing protein n=1 Tax=Macrophomina phaseolina (strain MS6) TaxID=1126212 RepID=K2S2Q7_MACPH|nr:hypothetical protein MPH_01396 [Macrophomina phaseolina MS6]
MVRDIPLSVLFSFPTPNYVDPVTRGPALIIVNAIFLSLCTIALLLRLYTRVFIKRWFGSDDVFIILAYISTVALTINVIIANVHFYWNRHVWDIPITSLPGALKVAFSAKLIFVFAATFTRQSLLCFYYRLIADSGMKWFKWALHATVVLNAAAAIIFTCLGIWLCTPISAYWDISSLDGARCFDEGKVVLGIGVVNCFIDLLITALPITIITRLQMPMQQRVGVMILLSLGFVVVVAGAVRTYYIWKGLVVSYDETWLTFPLWIAAAVEINLGVVCLPSQLSIPPPPKPNAPNPKICACMPALRPLISRYITPAFSNVSSRISSLISRGSHGSHGSTRQTSRTASAHDYPSSANRYRKFSDGKNDAITSQTIGSSASTTLKGGSKLSSKLSSRLGYTSSMAASSTTAATAAADADDLRFITSPIELDDRLRADSAAGASHDRDRLSTIPGPPSPSFYAHTPSSSSPASAGDRYGRGAGLTALPHIGAAPPLEITCRHSFEIVSLDRRVVGGGGSGERTPQLYGAHPPPPGATAHINRQRTKKPTKKKIKMYTCSSFGTADRHLDAFFTQHDGPLEAYLRKQVLANARVIYGSPSAARGTAPDGLEQDCSDDGAHGDEAEKFEVVLSSRLVTKKGFSEEWMAYTAVLVGWGRGWEGKEGEDDGGGSVFSIGVTSSEEGERVGERGGEEDSGGGSGSVNASVAVDMDEGSVWTKPAVEDVEALVENVSLGEQGRGKASPELGTMEGFSGVGKLLTAPEKAKVGKKFRHRVVQTGAVDCRMSTTALRTLVHEVLRDAGEWLYANGQEGLVQDINVLLEDRRKRDELEKERLRDAREAVV